MERQEGREWWRTVPNFQFSASAKEDACGKKTGSKREQLISQHEKVTQDPKGDQRVWS
jgi:hypothetical protein